LSGAQAARPVRARRTATALGGIAARPFPARTGAARQLHPSRQKPVLTVSNLSKSFGGFLAVNGLSFDVKPGEILGLIGPNGSGKSTVFNLVSGALRPTGGSIVFEGEDITGLPPDRICHRGIARTFQIPRPFRKLTLRENVVLAAYYGSNGVASPEQAEEQAIAALGTVGLPTDAASTTDTLGAAGLKKLELARALATQPRLLLADESLGGLDASEMDQAAGMLSRIRDSGITIVWVEHIMGVLMKVVDRVIVLDYGELISQGSPRQVASDPRVIEVYLGPEEPARK
jgi:branched-chain amino acid transport system ATP-binding protein